MAENAYDLVVIGGGSGGLACSKRAAKILGENGKVAVCDFVKPSWQDTTWGIGGTCVNVGCIPKKLMHNAGLIGEHIHDGADYGWKTGEKAHDWATMRENVNNYIRKLNWGYKVQLREKGVKYLNALAKFKDPHTLITTNKKGVTKEITAKQIVIAVGGRPRNLSIPGAEHTISSDDIFWMEKDPGKTLCIGASYISLECAGFLASTGRDTTVMVRSILLRGFDQEMANKVGLGLENAGVKFLRTTVPEKIEKMEDGRLKVHYITTTTTEAKDDEEPIATETRGSEIFDTVLVAIGRTADTDAIDLKNCGVQTHPRSKKVVGGKNGSAETSNVPHIHAIGDCLEGSQELTPVAIQAGKLLAERLFNKSTVQMDYKMVATTVFTPVEYGAIGYSEEDAIIKWGLPDLEVYAAEFVPLEWAIASDRQKDLSGEAAKQEHKGFCKLVCVKSQQERVVGFHYLGPNAGEVTQGYALGIKLGATKADFDNVVGIHPTTAETFTTMDITKSSGESVEVSGC